MKERNFFWQFVRLACLLSSLISFFFAVLFAKWWLVILTAPFNGEGNYFDPISEINYNNGPFWASFVQLLMALLALAFVCIFFLLYKLATVKWKCLRVGKGLKS